MLPVFLTVMANEFSRPALTAAATELTAVVAMERKNGTSNEYRSAFEESASVTWRTTNELEDTFSLASSTARNESISVSHSAKMNDCVNTPSTSANALI